NRKSKNKQQSDRQETRDHFTVTVTIVAQEPLAFVACTVSGYVPGGGNLPGLGSSKAPPVRKFALPSDCNQTRKYSCFWLRIVHDVAGVLGAILPTKASFPGDVIVKLRALNCGNVIGGLKNARALVGAFTI